MNPSERHRLVLTLFDQVCELPANDRAQFLAEHCPDPEVRSEVGQMLQHSEGTDAFVDASDPGRGLNRMAADVLGDGDADVPMPERIGRYVVKGMIGRGGMGIIYEAEQESPKRRVALKVLLPAAVSRILLLRFQHEAHILGQLQHPGIAQIHEAGWAELPHGRQPYFAMEFIDGAPIDEFVQTIGLRVQETLELVARVCDAVQHAHQKGVIHRDLKPSNILVVRREDRQGTRGAGTRTDSSGTSGHANDSIGQPKVLDFGIARITDADLKAVTVQTEVGQLIGTLAYMSPEQVSGRSNDLDTRCDVYSLGVVLYELLTGKRPHDLTGLAMAEAARVVCEQEPPGLAQLDRRLRGDIATIVAKAMDKDRDRRYDTAAELATDIRRHLAHQPIEARPAGTLYQLGKFARRNRGLVAGMTTALVALTLGLVGTTVSAIRANEESARAKRAMEDVELVSGFQGGMVRNIRLPDMGRLILDEVAKQLMDRGGSAELAAELETVQATSLARAVIDGSILSRASTVADEQFADSPVIRADILESLSTTYHSLAMYEPCLREMRRVLAIRREHLGDAHPDTIKALGSVGSVLMNLRQFAEAEPVLKEALQRRRATLDEHDPMVFEARMRLAELRLRIGPLDQAEAELKSLVEFGQRVFPPSHRPLLYTMTRLAAVYAQTNRPAEALALRQQVLETRRKFHDDDLETLALWNQIAQTLSKLQRYDEAEASSKELLELAEHLLGDDDPRTCLVLAGLARTRLRMGKLEEGRADYERLLERRQRAQLEQIPMIQTVERELADLIRRLETQPRTE